MTLLQKIPLTPETSDQLLDIELGGNPYRLRVMWNERFRYWSLSIMTADGEPILTNIKMVTDYNLTGRFVDSRLPFGYLFFTSGTDARPSYSDLGTVCNLYYYEPDAEVIDQPVREVTTGDVIGTIWDSANTQWDGGSTLWDQ